VPDSPATRSEEPSDGPVALSESFLLGVRRGESTEAIAADLAGRESQDLAAALDTDGARLAFWVNAYNAVTQRALDDNSGQYENRRAFFSAPLVTVAGQELSLNDIEHSILRRAYSQYTLGYIRRPSPLRGEFIERHAVAERDPRIHFALNCGAESCPPIAAYTREEIDDQLDLATRGYLDQTVEFDPDAGGVLSTVFGPGRATVPRVMLWFRGDFGGKSGILDCLRRYDQLPADASPRLSYRDWNWSLDLGDYTDEPAETS